MSTAANTKGYLTIMIYLAVSLLLVGTLYPVDAYDPLDPFGQVSIKWDVLTWADQGYQATVYIINTQQYRQIDSYMLGWHWHKDEIIWSMNGAEAKEQGDCSKHSGNLPHSCVPNPHIVDLSPGAPYSMQSANCCRNGVIAAYAQDPKNSVSTFAIAVGNTGTTNTTIYMPENLILRSPGFGYTCSAFKKVPASKFLSADGKRNTQAIVTWNATCTYSQHLAQMAPTCCVSLSAFYSETIVPCQECACSCSPNTTGSGTHLLPGTDQTCVTPNSQEALDNALSNGVTSPQLYCTNDMCPVKIHWHIKENYKQYWRAKITITNRNIVHNYTNWNLVIQHPNFLNFAEAFSFTEKPLTPYGDVVNDTAMFWGVQYYNDMLMQAGPDGNVQSEILFAKDSRFTLSHGWAFPQRVYFNGDDCVMPAADQFPSLPNGSTSTRKVGLVSVILFVAVGMFVTSLIQ